MSEPWAWCFSCRKLVSYHLNAAEWFCVSCGVRATPLVANALERQHVQSDRPPSEPVKAVTPAPTVPAPASSPTLFGLFD